jgi:tetratricopeptide (TPR) repeat protein
MKRKEFIIPALVLLLAFAVLAIFKNRGKASAEAKSNVAKNSDSIQRFWNDYNLATQLRMQEKTDSAISVYRRAIDLNPAHEDALYYLGIVYMKAGDLIKAKESWERLIEVNPQSERAYYQLGNLYFCVKQKSFFDPEKAKTFFNRANELNKEAVNPELRLGEIALFQNKMKEASVAFEKLLIMDHKNLEVSFLTGYLKWKTGNDAEAIADLANAFTLIKTLSKNATMDENQDCDLFPDWINRNLATYEKQDIRTALPQVYTKFDQYLISIHSLLNKH